MAANKSKTQEVSQPEESPKHEYLNKVVDSGVNTYQNRLLVGTITIGNVRMEWASCRYGQAIPANWSKVDMLQYMTSYVPIRFSIQDGQNLIVQEAVTKGYEWLMLIEDDTCPPPDGFIRFNEYIRSGKYPIVSGLYYTKSVPAEPMIYRGRGNSYYTDWKLGDRIMVDGVPTGLLIINCKLLKAVWDDSPEYMTGPYTVRRVFENPIKTWFNEEKGSQEALVGTTDLDFCFTPETVVTGNKIQPISDFVVGDKVYTHTGSLKEVTNIFERLYEGHIIEIKAKRSAPIQMTPNHKILINRKNSINWIEAESVVKGDYVAYPRINTTDNDILLLVESYVKGIRCVKGREKLLDESSIVSFYERGNSTNQIAEALGVDQKTISKLLKRNKIMLRGIEHSKKLSKNAKPIKELSLDYIKIGLQGEQNVLRAEIPLDKDLMTFFGFWIAEGHVSKSNSHVVFSFNKTETNYINEIVRIGKEKFDLIAHVGNTNTATQIQFSSPVLARLLSALFGKGALNKKIHSDLMSLNNELLGALLGAYFKGDGCFTGNKFSAVTISYTLAQQVKILLAKLGFHASIGTNLIPNNLIEERIVNAHAIYSINIANRNNEDINQLFNYGIFNIKNGRNSELIDNNYIWLKVLSIKSTAYKGKVYNLEVKDDNTYLTESFIVHNCKRVIEGNYLDKAGWPELAKKKYPFVLDTRISAMQIDQSGQQYPIQGIQQWCLENGNYPEDGKVADAIQVPPLR